MGRRLTLTERIRHDQEEAIIFDLFSWWQQQHPDASLHELADWWDQNRSIRTQEEFSRLLTQILKQQPGALFRDYSASEQAVISHELQQRIEQGVLRCIAYL